MNSLSLTERKTLEEVHGIFLELEKTAKDAAFDEARLRELKNLLAGLRRAGPVEVHKLAEIASHLHSSMSLRHFSNFLVPVERALKKNLKDSDFLIQTQDKTDARTEKLPIKFVVENLRSAFNVGSLFRSAEAMGLNGLELVGYSPTPDQESVQKTAMGTAQLVSWRHFPDLASCLKKLKAEGYLNVALETVPDSKSLFEPMPRQPTAFIFGNERFGLDTSALKICDEIRHLPLIGRKNSLNIASCAAIVAAEWSRQWNSR